MLSSYVVLMVHFYLSGNHISFSPSYSLNDKIVRQSIETPACSEGSNAFSVISRGGQGFHSEPFTKVWSPHVCTENP